MSVRLTTPVLGLAVGATYTGPLESWLLNEGYATTSAAVPDAWAKDSDGVLGGKVPTVVVTPTAATLVGTTDAVALTATGTVVFGVRDGVSVSVNLATADTPAAAATKIDTALTGYADASVVANKLNVVSVATGVGAFVKVVSGTAAILTNLGLAVGQTAFGGNGLPTGASNLGAQADVPANDPQLNDNREPGYFLLTPDNNVTIANDATNLTKNVYPAPINFDFDAGAVDAEKPSLLKVVAKTGPIAGGKVVSIFGDNLQGTTGVTFGGVAGTALDVSTAAKGVIKVTIPAHAAGAVDVVVTDNIGSTTLTNGFTYA